MSYNREEVSTRVIVDGRPMIVGIIQNPVIDDVVIAEAQVQASLIVSKQDGAGRRVDRTLRDFLIRLGVER